MIWDSKKKATAVFEDGTEINFEFKVPTMKDYEELGDTANSNEAFLKKFLISCDGFENADALYNAGGAMALVYLIVKTIAESGNVPVTLKNA